MSKTIREIKRTAKSSLKNCMGKAMLAVVTYYVVDFVFTRITGMVFTGGALWEIILNLIFSFGVAMLVSVFGAGLSYMLLKMSRGQDASMGDLLYFFKKYPDRVLVAAFFIGLVGVLTSLPSIYVGYITESETMLEWMQAVAPWMLVGTLANIVLVIPFTMAFFLMADNQEMDGLQAIKGSVRMMKGNILRYLCMQLSFIPLLFLSIFTLYLALLWILPYIQMSSVIFYRDLNGEFVPQAEDTSANMY